LIQENALHDEYAISEGLKEKNEEYMKGAMKTMTGQFAGLHRFTVTDPEFHKRIENLHLAKKLWGFTSYEFLQDMTEALYGVTPDKDRVEKMKRLVLIEKGDQIVHLNSYALTDYESCLMTLMWMENDAMDYGMLQCIWGVKDDKTLTDKIKVWSDIIGVAGEHLSILRIDKPFLDKTLPSKYKWIGMIDTACVVDGKDIKGESVRNDRLASNTQRSNKVGWSAIRELTWSTPMGLIFEYTRGFLSRASEKAIMLSWGSNGRLKLPIGMVILGDKGFECTTAAYPNYNVTHHPAFLTNDQFNITQMGLNTQISQVRYTSEVVYARVTNRKSLYGYLERHRFSYFDELNAWAHGRANLYQPLLPLDDDE